MAVTVSRLEIDSRQLDILGLGLVAIGVFLAGVAYLGWSGGTLGRDAMRATRFTLAVIGYGVPGVLAAGGALVLVRDSIPTGRP